MDLDVSQIQRTPFSFSDPYAGAAGLVVDPEEFKPSLLGDLFAAESLFEITEEEVEDLAHDTVSGQVHDPVWDEVTARMIKASCAFFAQEVLPGSVHLGGHFFIGDHHIEWDELVMEYDRLCVLAPRGHGKSHWFTFAYPLWLAETRPWEETFIFSKTAEQAAEKLDAIRIEIETNPKLRHLLPDRPVKWSSRQIWLANGHRIYARGFGTSVRGAHPTTIIVDDGLNDETIYSSTVRDKQNDYFYTAITNMIEPKGKIIVIGTPFHVEDLYGTLKKNSEYEFRQYQALKEDGAALWPERFPPGELARIKREIGEIRFTREFQTDPIADDMSLFPFRLFRGDPTEQYNLVLGMPGRFWNQLGVTCYTGVDIAISSSVKADYMVVWTMGVDAAGNRWLVNIRRAHGMGYQEQLSVINEEAREYGSVLVMIEANQAQRVWGDELIRLSDLPIKLFVTGVQKHSLEVGVPSLRVLLENHKFRIPRGDRYSVEATDIWINEMRSFTWHDGKLQSVGGHDDTVMACWICDQAIRHGAFGFSFGEEAGDQDLDALLEEMMGGSGSDDDDLFGMGDMDLDPRRREARDRERAQAEQDTLAELARRAATLHKRRRAKRPPPAVARSIRPVTHREGVPGDLDTWDGVPADQSVPAAPTAIFQGELGKSLMVQQGYVPKTCTLDPAYAGTLIYSEIMQQRSPCWGCNEDRKRCGGEPRREGRSVAQVQGFGELRRARDAGAGFGAELEVLDGSAGAGDDEDVIANLVGDDDLW